MSLAEESTVEYMCDFYVFDHKTSKIEITAFYVEVFRLKLKCTADLRTTEVHF